MPRQRLSVETVCPQCLALSLNGVTKCWAHRKHHLLSLPLVVTADAYRGTRMCRALSVYTATLPFWVKKWRHRTVGHYQPPAFKRQRRDVNSGSVGPQLSEFLTHVLPGSGGRLVAGWGGARVGHPPLVQTGIVRRAVALYALLPGAPQPCLPPLPPHGTGAPTSHGAAPEPAPLQALPRILHQGPLHEASTVWAKARIQFPWQQPGNFAVTSVLARTVPRPRKGEPSTQGYTAQGFKPEGPCFLGARQAFLSLSQALRERR